MGTGGGGGIAEVSTSDAKAAERGPSFVDGFDELFFELTDSPRRRPRMFVRVRVNELPGDAGIGAVGLLLLGLGITGSVAYDSGLISGGGLLALYDGSLSMFSGTVEPSAPESVLREVSMEEAPS